MALIKGKKDRLLSLLISLVMLLGFVARAESEDLDGDGLSNEIEAELGTNPNDADTDDDGLQDGLEYYFSQAYNVRVVFYKNIQMISADLFTLDPLDPSDGNADTDGDGLSNAFELLNGLDLLNAEDALYDADGDGLSNIAEFQLGTAVNNVDSDGDGLEDGSEVGLGTDPNNADSDNDGLQDGFEYYYRQAYNVRTVYYKNIQSIKADYFTLNPLDATDAAADFDSDGLSNIFEIQNGLNPVDAADALYDADGDGLTNIAEMQYGTDINNADSDGDGLSDGHEVSLGTDPNDADTDNDGLQDGVEHEYSHAYNVRTVFYKNYQMVTADLLTLNPLDGSDGLGDSDGDGLSNSFEALNGLNFQFADDALYDSDGDGLTNLAEMEYGTDLNNNDTDGDGINDSNEINSGLDPIDATDGALDPDGDGFSNYAEFLAGSDFLDGSNVPELSITLFSASQTSVSEVGASVLLSWASQGSLSVTLSAVSEDQNILLATFADLPTTGSLEVLPTLSSRYQLQVIGPNGAVTSELTISAPVGNEVIGLWSENIFLSGDSQQIKTSVVVDESGTAYAGSFDGNLYRSSPNGDVAVFYANSGVVLNKPLLTESHIIFGANGDETAGGRVCALSYDQTMSWVFDTASSVVSTPVLDSNSAVVYAITYDGVVHALDSGTGDALWEYHLPNEEVCATPVLTNNQTTLVIHTVANKIYSLDLNAIAASAGDGINWVRSMDE